MTVGEMKIQCSYDPLSHISIGMLWALFFTHKYSINIFHLEWNKKLVLLLSTSGTCLVWIIR